jgi:hypothetical protein
VSDAPASTDGSPGLLSKTLQCVWRARALLDPLHAEHQMPADRDAILRELRRLLEQIGADLAASIEAGESQKRIANSAELLNAS